MERVYVTNFLQIHLSTEKFSLPQQKNVLQSKVSEIINDCLKEDNNNNNNYIEMTNNLSQYKNIFRYVYSNVFPELYCSTERIGFHLKGNFHIMFKTYKDKKK